jgi:hypothetical protein
MAPTQAQVLAETTLWVQQFTAASVQLQTQTTAAVEAGWSSFTKWYDAVAVAAIAAEMANLSTVAQHTTAGLSAQYATQVAAAALGVPAPRVPRNMWSQVRDGKPLRLVHTRPAEVFKKAIATGATHEEAVARAVQRGTGLVTSDVLLEDRAVQRAVFERMGVTGYRRIIHPELSRTGTCGLCIAAADRVYSTNELMPLHPPSCNCSVLPIVGDIDPGLSLNEQDLKTLYADAGSTKAFDLRRTGYKSLEELRAAGDTAYAVHEHGELGPMLARPDDKFRSARQVPLEEDPARAARMLAKVEPVLVSLEERAANGENVADPLAYQRELIDRLRGIVATAA